MSDTPTDYFVHQGYRKLILRLLLQSMADLQRKPNSEENLKIIEETRNWVMYDPEPWSGVPHKRQGGLSFADCFYALGQASEVAKLREVALREPQTVASAVSKVLDAMNAEEAVFVDLRQQRQSESISVGSFDTSWLFGGQPKSSMRSSFNG